MIKLLTVKEVAEILKAKPSTIYAWAEQRIIPCFKLNGLLRFSPDDVTAWINSNHRESSSGYNNSASRRPKKGGNI